MGPVVYGYCEDVGITARYGSGLTVMASLNVFARGVDHSLELVDEHLAPEQAGARRDSASLSLITRLAI